jgi:hypothetical protein
LSCWEHLGVRKTVRLWVIQEIHWLSLFEQLSEGMIAELSENEEQDEN